MKKVLFSIAFMALCLLAKTQELLTHAVQKAKQEDRYILINFSGSDWCIPCIQMQQE
ncbi:MAG: thioredoxin family protein, partial [Sphingobacteriales bacterium]